MLLLLFPCSSVFSRSICVAVSAWFQPRLGLHGGASPPLTSPLLPPTNPSETDILAPALRGVAQNAIGMVPGADHCTRDGAGGRQGTGVIPPYLYSTAAPVRVPTTRPPSPLMPA